MARRKIDSPITIRGVTYATFQEAADAHGVKRSTIYMAVKCGRIDTIGYGSGGLKMLTRIRRVVYPSQTAAASALGVTTKAIHMAAERGTLDLVGLNRNRSWPIECDGVVYANIKAFAEANKWKPHQVYNGFSKAPKDEAGYTIWKGKRFKKMKDGNK